jgi:hypothetical protein
MASSAPVQDPVRVPSIQHPTLRAFAVVGLLAVGLALLVLGAAIWLDRTAPGKSTTSNTSTTTVTKHAAATTTTVNSTDTTTPGSPSIRSEAVAGTLFALGALVFLCGMFFSRIAEVTLPGGAGFKLAPATQAKVVEKVAAQAKAKGLPLEPGTLRQLYEATLVELGAPTSTTSEPAVGYTRASRGQRQTKQAQTPAAPSGEPSDEILDAAVHAAMQRIN